jgi:hypothetical protein
MNKFIIVLLVMLISGVAAVKTDANVLDRALGVMVLIEKLEQFCGQKPERRKPSKRGKTHEEKKSSKE